MSSQFQRALQTRQTNRRGFFKNSLGFAGVLATAPSILSALLTSTSSSVAKAADTCGAATLVEPGKGMAASVNYHNKFSEVKDAKLKTERQGVKWGKQNCQGCMLFTACGKKGNDEVGKCTIFAGQIVKANGWCSTWNKKA